MPVGKFTKCLSGDISHVSKSKYFSHSKVAEIWPTLFDQHLKAHGLPGQYETYLQKMTAAAAFYAEAYNGKRWQILRARIKEAEAEALLTGAGEKIESTCARISKIMGFPVRANECSVVEFYNYIAIIGDS